MRKIVFVIVVMVVMMPCSVREQQMSSAQAALTHIPHVRAPAGALTCAPRTMASRSAMYLPVVLAEVSTTPPVQNATATARATHTITASPAPTQTPTASTVPTYTPTPTPSQTPTATPALTDTPSPTPTEGTLVIGHITDAHIGLGWLESQRLALVVSTVSQEAEVMVDTGDCTAHGAAAECVEYVDLVSNSATIPWRAVMGPFDSPHTFEAHIGPLEWSWDVGAYRLIGINTEAINYTALDQALTTEKPCIIFGHFPLDECSPADQNNLRQRFLTYDIPIYIAGHAHLNSLETDRYSGTLLLIGQRTVRCHYRLITLRSFEVESIEFKLACQ